MLLKIVIFSSQYFLSIILLFFSLRFASSILPCLVLNLFVDFRFAQLFHNLELGDQQKWSSDMKSNSLWTNSLIAMNSFSHGNKNCSNSSRTKKTLPASTTSWSTFFFFVSKLFHFRFHSVHMNKKITWDFAQKIIQIALGKKKKCSVVYFLFYFLLNQKSNKKYFEESLSLLIIYSDFNTISIELINEIFVIFIFSTLSRHTRKKEILLILIEARTRNHWRSTRLDVRITSE